MPVTEADPGVNGTSSGPRLALALGCGAVGLASAFLGRERPSLQWLTAGAWLAALVTFGSAWTHRRLVVPPSTAALAAAGVLSILATRAWFLAPLALAGWTVVASLLDVRWTVILGAAAASLAAAAVVLPFGAGAVSDFLAVLAYGLACLACCTAAVSRIRREGRRVR